jgi:hypothetical protein
VESHRPACRTQAFMTEPDGRIVVEVRQRVLGKDGNALSEGTVQHVYQVRDGLTWDMKIRKPVEDANPQDHSD